MPRLNLVKNLHDGLFIRAAAVLHRFAQAIQRALQHQVRIAIIGFGGLLRESGHFLRNQGKRLVRVFSRRIAFRVLPNRLIQPRRMAWQKSLAFPLRRRVCCLPRDVVGKRQRRVSRMKLPETRGGNKPERAEFMKFYIGLLFRDPRLKLRRVFRLSLLRRLIERDQPREFEFGLDVRRGGFRNGAMQKEADFDQIAHFQGFLQSRSD